MDMQTKTFSYSLLWQLRADRFVSGAQLSPLLLIGASCKVLITQDETTLILDYKLGRSIMLVLLIFATSKPQVK
jgi:hypothetical protein